MPSYARKDLIPDGADCLVHAVSRCVRRAWLCGADPLTGREFSHRRQWVVERLRHLAAHFAVEVFAYSVMANHYHVVLRCRPSAAAGWGPEDVARRWLGLRDRRRTAEEWERDLRSLASDPARVEVYRGRLGSVSWFMRFANEWVARRANAEDGCTGRFWEGRFRCQLLEDDAALLACMAYVDLNPVRAGAAAGLGGSLFTSVRERLLALRRPAGAEPGVAAGAPAGREEAGTSGAGWLAPMAEVTGPAEGAITIRTADYVDLLEWTGSPGRQGMARRIPERRPPGLAALGLDAEGWHRLAADFGRMFRRVAGRPGAMDARARALGRRWLVGVRASRELFLARAA